MGVRVSVHFTGKVHFILETRCFLLSNLKTLNDTLIPRPCYSKIEFLRQANYVSRLDLSIFVIRTNYKKLGAINA